MKKRRYREAFESFCRLRNTKLIAARDLVSRSNPVPHTNTHKSSSTMPIARSSQSETPSPANHSPTESGNYSPCLDYAAQ